MIRRLLVLCSILAALSAIPVSAASAASLDFDGSVLASSLDIGGTLLFSVPTGGVIIDVFGYTELDSGLLTGTGVTDIASLAGVVPSDLSISFGDLERVSTAYSPAGCMPISGNPSANCDFAISSYGDADAGPSFIDVTLAGVGTILSGQVLDAVVTTDSNVSSPGFTMATALSQIQFTGGLDPYFAEILAASGGTGRAEIRLDSFVAACIPGTNPCGFGISGSLTIIPEPSTSLLVGLGLLGLGVRHRST